MEIGKYVYTIPILGVCIVGMSNKHKNILRLKRTDLLRSIHVNEQFLSELTSNSIITPTMKEEIEVSNCTALFYVCRFRMMHRDTIDFENKRSAKYLKICIDVKDGSVV